MTTKIMQRLAGKVSVLIMVALLIAAVGTYGLSNSKHDNTGRATAAVTPSMPAAAAPVAGKQATASVAKDVSVSVRTTSIQTVPIQSGSFPAGPTPFVGQAPPAVAQAQMTPLANARTTYAKTPLSFIPNQGQFEKGVEFEGRGSGYIASLTDDSLYVGLHSLPTGHDPVKQSIVRLGFAGANKLHFQALEKQASFANYIGGPASHWQQHVPTYGRVTAANVYPGIDTTFYGNRSNLQFDFVVQPGADPKAIRLNIEGGQVKLNENGDLAIATELGAIYQRKPVLYQEANGVRQPVDGSYKLDGNTVSFEVGSYDSSRTLTIDPLMNFSLVVGGLADTKLNAVADDMGAVYVAGTTTSNTLNLVGPATISGARAASSQSDAIVVSFTRDGTTVNWYTFIGGSDQDSGNGVAVEDPTFNIPTPPSPGFPNAQFGVYVVGQTFSNDLALNAPASNTYQGGGDGFIIRLDGTGALAPGAGNPKYIGSSNGDSATSVAVRCHNSCATHAGLDEVYVGMFVGGTINTPALTPQSLGGFGSGAQAGALVELRATTLGTGGGHGDVMYINGAQSAAVTALALLPFPTAPSGPTGTLQDATRLAFVGNVAAPGALNGNTFINSVQGGHGGVDGFGFGGGNSDGLWGVTNTHMSGGGTAFDTVFNLDYVGGAGNDNFKSVAILPDGNLVAVGDTNALPITTTGAGGVIVGNLPLQNTSFGSAGTSPAGGAEDVVAVIINPGGTPATATATAGATATATATRGTIATPTITGGTVATIAAGAAGANATSTVTGGTTATATVTQGTNGTLTITPGVQATATPTFTGTALTGITITNNGMGYWNQPTLSFTGGTCTITPTAHVLLTIPVTHPTADGTIPGTQIDNAGSCTVAPTIAIQAPGIQALAVNTPGNGYQSGTGPIPITFNGTCTTAPVASVNIGAGNPVATVYPGNTAAAANTNAGLSTVNITNPAGFGLGCSVQPTTATPNTPAGIQKIVIATGGTGYQGGTVLTATITGGGCSGVTASFTVQAGTDQTLLTDNILTNSGSCTSAPTATIPPPGVATMALVTGGTGYCGVSNATICSVVHTPAVVVNGTCSSAPTVSLTFNNVGGNITAETLTNSGNNCTVQPTTETIDAPGITNIQVLTQGSGYDPAHPPAVTIAPPTGPSGSAISAGQNVGTHCNATAHATATVSAGGQVTGIVVTDAGCGYLTNPTVTIAGPGVTIGGLPSGTGYSASNPPVITVPAGFCNGGGDVAPTLGVPVITGVSGSTGGAITGIPITNVPSCTTNIATTPLTVTGNPGVVAITPGNTGNSYNTAPTVTVPSCTNPPTITDALLGAAPTGVDPASYAVTNYGAGCPTASPAVVITAPGLLAPPTAGQILTPPVVGSAFTVTSPGLGYSVTPTVTVTGCSTAPAATACIAGLPSCSALVPPAIPGTLASINLNTNTSGGNGCVAPTVTLTGGIFPGFTALDYLGGTGNDFGNGVATDSNSNIYITGQTASSNFPVITNPAWTGSTSLKGPSDGFVARITENGGTVQGNNGGGFSTYFGGTTGPDPLNGGNDSFNAVVADKLLNIFLAGQTWSSDFPITQGSAFSGNSDGTLTNLLFNNMIITGPAPATTPTTTALFTAAFDGPSPASQTFNVNFANVTLPYSVAGGTVGGAPGTAITYSANSSIQWLSITSAAGGFTLNVNQGFGSGGLAPDNYSATFVINAPNADTPPVTFTVLLSVSATFQVFNCTTPCTAGTLPVSNFNFTYTKVQSAAVSAQQMLVGLLGVAANAPTGNYPAPGTFQATVNYNTNPTALVAGGIGPVAATNANFKWFNIAGQDCSTACTQPFGTNLPLTINPAVLDTMWQSGVNGTNVAQGNITFTKTSPGGGSITSITITVTAQVTPRIIFTSADPTTLPGIQFAFSCTGGAPPAPCTTINPSSTNHVQMRAKDDVINVTSNGNPNKMVVLNITSTPPGGSATCFSGAPGGVQVPNGSYQAPSSDDPTATDLSLPVQVNINNGNAVCVQGVYTGTLTISGAAANLGAGDSIKTTAGFNALGPNDSPVATAPVTVPVTITLGNELYITDASAFAFGTYNIDSQEGLPAGNPIPTVPVSHVSLTLPPAPWNTTFNVKCTVDPIAGLYTPSTGTQTGATSATCDWLTASVVSNTLSGGASPTTCAATPSSCTALTVALTPVGGTNNVTTLPTDGGPTGNSYTGHIQLIYTSGTLAGSSLVYPVTLTAVRQPLNWVQPGTSTPAGLNPGNTGSVAPTTTFTTNIGGGVPAPVSCGSLYSNENFINEGGGGEYIAGGFNPRTVGLRVAALANQTFAAFSPSVGAAGASVTAGWLTVAQSGTAGSTSGTADTLTCSLNLTNLAAGVYTACVDAVDLGPGGSAAGPSPAFFTGATDCTSAATGAWPNIGRLVAKVVLNLQAPPQLQANPSSFTFNFQQGSGGNSGFQSGPGLSTSPATLTLTDLSTTQNIQGVFATTTTPWLALTGPATVAGGVNVPASGSTPVTVTVNPPACGVAQCNFSGTITLACDNCTLLSPTVTVNLQVNGVPSITTVPGTLTNFTFQQGGPTPATDNLVVNLTSGSGNVIMTPSSCNTPGITCAGGTWLQVNGAAAPTASQPITTTGIQFSVGVDPAALNALAASNTPYNGSVSISVPGATNTPVILNVSVTVIAQPVLNTTNNGTAFTFTVGGANPNNQSISVSTSTTSGQVATAGFTLTPTSCSTASTTCSNSNWLQINGVSTVVSNTANNVPLNFTISVNTTTLAALAATVPAGSSSVFNGSIAIATTVPPASSVVPTVINYTLTISNQPIVTIGSCTPSGNFAYTLTTPATTPTSIVCTVSDSSSVVGINNLAVAGCPASWETCVLGATSIGPNAPNATTTLTLTPTNLANQNPGTFGPPNITISGTNNCPAPFTNCTPGPAVTGTVPGISITNTPLINVPTTTLTFGPYTQGNLTQPGNQTVTGNLAEGSGGTPSGPGTPGTGVLTSIVAASSFTAGSCTGGVTTGPANWLGVTQTPTPAAGSGSTATNYSFVIDVNPAVFGTLSTDTTCTGAITINSTGVTPAGVTKTIPVTFTIHPQSGLSVSTPAGNIPSGGNLTPPFTIVNGYPVGLTSTAAPIPVTVSSAPTQGQQYTVTIQPVTGGNWLTSSACTTAVPCTANATTAGFSLGVAAAANTLAPGTYNATVAVAPAGSSSSPSNTVTFVATLNVDNTAVLSTTGTPALTAGSFNLGTHFPFFTAPTTQTLNVATASPSAGAPATPAQFTVTQTSLNGSTPGNLLVINGTQPFTTTGTSTTVPVTITYNASVANTLGTTAPGIYGGTVTVLVTQTGVTTVPQSIAIPWSITIDQEANIQTTPTAQQGVVITCVVNTICTGTTPPFTLGVAATSTGQNVNIPISASTTSLPTPWLSITSAPTNANSTSIVMSVNAAGLQIGTAYAGQVVITSPAAANSPYTVPVTLNVVGPTLCTPAASPISLTSAGTSTGGVLPQTPITVTFTNNTALCTGTYSVSSNVPWLTATGGAGVTFTALSNAHSTPQVGTLTITNSSNSASVLTLTVTEAGSTAPQIPNRQITALYQTILGRDPDAAGYNYWVTSGLPLGYMADDFYTNPETFNTDFAVMAAYQGATGAPPSFNQFMAAIANVRAGTQTIPALFSSLITGNPSYSATTLYQYLLNRTPTAAEANACTNLAACFQTLIGFPANTNPVAAPNNEFQSTGTFSHSADHTNGLYITMLYITILGRDPDQGGYNFWLGVANAGGAGILFQANTTLATRIQILGPGTQGQGFIGSNEFVTKYQ